MCIKDSLLPEGLTLLAGKPKQGKSWLALSAALSIAAGGVALGTQPVTQGEVLYLALEDNARRLQGRARQLLSSMSGVPGGMDFALNWPRLGEGGLALLEDYVKAHPGLRLAVIDTWARVAPPAGKRRSSQYEGDYEALIPLKQLADTYHVSILAVHHLRKTGSSDVLDEITGSIGMTGAVDGTLILKRERGQAEATLFVTGRDIDCEQHLALSFDATTALWTIIGSVEEVGRSRARQQILDLLREQPEGMNPREVAEALEKNYHTTRSLLRKMEESGEVSQRHGKYLALAGNQSRERVPFAQGNGQINQAEHQQKREQTASGDEGSHDYAGAPHSNATDYSDYADDGHDIPPTSVDSTDDDNALPVTSVDATDDNHDISVDTVDYADDGHDTAADACLKEHPRAEAATLPGKGQSIPPGEQAMPLPQDRHQQAPAISSVITRNQRNQRHQWPDSEPVVEEGVFLGEADQDTRGKQSDLSFQRNRCPHHPQARMVRCDPAGQAWCGRLECWDCYRLMKIGEALDYRCLEERGGKRLIEQGREAWAAYVLTQRAFLVTWATQEALAQCRVLGIQEPELSGEAQRLHQVQSLPP